ncbi:ABC transporter ATP-binding protein [uncultured Mailhella sp.]|uniref:ABC transporter ATP-binding protein n=1 Tax=uncultured Mailhella sp. TaxID=1981031 RepID=UPI0025F9CE4A|nr:ABC transporter ATP-binding protein [uncultured Mailhella sp.]
MDGARPLLELQSVAKAFGPRLLFRRIDLALMPGTLSLLAGANGAGKSTLMRVMAGLTKPDSGTVLRRVPDEKLGYMAHATFLYPGLDAEENLLFWARAAGLDHAGERVTKALETVGLLRHAHERAGIFSRGMAQRLNLARLLLAEPSLILLDEPATGLDVSSRAMLMELMLKARSEGAAILWISHDTSGDSRHADRVLTLENRSLREEAGGLS